jgi:DNA invertase Pin-like site-specific DNA recombinase
MINKATTTKIPQVVTYSRFSSDLQSDTSIADQIRICQHVAEKEGWQVTMDYSDYAISGSSMHRDGIQALMSDAAKRQFDIVVCEDLSRLSRDQENIAGIYKRLTFAGVQIYSLSDGGFVSDIHIGLKGTMNQLYLKDLAIKTKRGQRGRIEQGKFAAGRPAYGYDLVKRFDAAGEPVKGERVINQEQAPIVRRIFEEYATGKSPRLIVMDLNKDGLFNAKGNAWSSTSLIGSRHSGTGMLNNELYIGRMIWNRRQYAKHPDTGRKVGRTSPIEERVVYELPELRIINQDLWDKVKTKQIELSKHSAPHTKRRPKGLFSFLMKCGCCGKGFSKISKFRYGCTSARKQGTCDNRITIDQRKLERTILSGLQTKLMQPECFEAFCGAYEQQINSQGQQHQQEAKQAKRKLAKLDTEKANLVEAIKNGIPAHEIKDEFTRIAQQREQAEKAINHQDAPTANLTPDMPARYQEEVQNLLDTLNDEENRYEAVDLIRSLIEKIELTPDKDNKKLKVNIYGDLAGMLCLASNQEAVQLKTLSEAFDKGGGRYFIDDENKRQVKDEYRAKNCWLKC